MKKRGPEREREREREGGSESHREFQIPPIRRRSTNNSFAHSFTKSLQNKIKIKRFVSSQRIRLS